MTINRECKITDWDPGIRPLVEKINDRWPTLAWGTYGGHHPTKGRATDGMVPNYKTAAGNNLGWECARWLWANRKALHIWYVIFDGKWITESNPGAGWQTYYPAAAAIRNSPDSAYHRNHPHASFYAVPAAPKHLPVYVVDPEEVSTTLTANALQAGEKDEQRPPGFRITTGWRISGDWLITEQNGKDNRSYHLGHLVLESEFLKRPEVKPEPPAPPVVVEVAAVREALESVPGLTGGPATGTITALLAALEEQAKTRGFQLDAEGKA